MKTNFEVTDSETAGFRSKVESLFVKYYEPCETFTSLHRRKVRALKIGDEVLISGVGWFTGRNAVHK